MARETILSKVMIQIKSISVYIISKSLCPCACLAVDNTVPLEMTTKNEVHLAVLASVMRLARHVRPSKQQPCVAATKDMLLGHGSTGNWLHWPPMTKHWHLQL